MSATASGGQVLAPPNAAQWVGRVGFARSFSGSGYAVPQSVAVDSSGRIVLAGFYSRVDFGGGPLTDFTQEEPEKLGVDEHTPASPMGIFVAAFEPNGQHAWSRGFGPIFGSEYSAHVAPTPDGGLIVAGDFHGLLEFGQHKLISPVDMDVFVAKLDRDGKPLWSKRFGTPSGDQKCSGVSIDAQGSLLLGGNFSGSWDLGGSPLSSTSAGGWVAKLDAEGHHSWSRAALPSVWALGVAPGAEGAVVAGHFARDFEIAGTKLTRSNGSAYVARLDGAGSPVWARQIGGNVHGMGVTTDTQGGAVVSGSFEESFVFGRHALKAVDREDGFVARIDSKGEVAWLRALGSPGQDRITGAAIDPRGNVAITGFCSRSGTVGDAKLECASAGMGNLVAAVLDPSGHTRWARSFGDDKWQSGSAAVFSRDRLVVAGDGYGSFDVDDQKIKVGPQKNVLFLTFAP